LRNRLAELSSPNRKLHRREIGRRGFATVLASAPASYIFVSLPLGACALPGTALTLIVCKTSGP
jgi:hypothetical protein